MRLFVASRNSLPEATGVSAEHMSSATTTRRSSRSVKQVSYLAITVESSEDGDTYGEPISISDDSDADAAPAKRKRVAKSTKSSRNAGPKKNISSLDASGPFEASHATSRHDPQRLVPYLPALLDWFEEKREARGMPWRKVYDPNLTKQERGQRAYEVLVSEVSL
jgi:A/G-specific adenine glycosylase